MRTSFLLFIGVLFITSSCLNNDLNQISLTSTTIGGIAVADPKVDSTFVQDDAIIVSNNFNEKLIFANLNASDIDQVTANLVVLELLTPSDSTFSVFRDLTLSLKNASDSVAFAEIGDFTETNSNQITLRVINQDVKSLLIADNFSLEMAYTILTDSLPAGLEVAIGVEWLMEGEL